MSDNQPTSRPANTKRNAAIGLAVAAFILVADQIIKIKVEAQLPFQQAVEILPVFSLFYTFNTGIAFSFMNNLTPLALVGIACVVVIIMLYLWWQARDEGLLPALGYGMILGGAIGNIIDRAVYGHVIDYVLLHAGGYSFAVFNLADAALTVGVIAILIASIFIGSTTDEQDKE
ncbi:MAG: signal peptidase II [Hyphomicrobiales bacterium]